MKTVDEYLEEQLKNPEFKKEYVPTSEFSYQELAFQSGIGNPSTITMWVSKFRVAGLSPVQYRLRYTAV